LDNEKAADYDIIIQCEHDLRRRNC